jgi:hypothetical protein
MIYQKKEIDSLFFEHPFEEVITDVIRLIQQDQSITTAVISKIRKLLPHLSLSQQQIVLDIASGTIRGQRLGKFPIGWFVTSILAEQATHQRVSHYHGSKFQGLQTVIEVCTGSGNDTVALAENVQTVHTFENNYLHYLLAQWNCNKFTVKNVHFHFGSIEESDLSSIRYDGLWADPSRRDEKGNRKFTVSGYSPSLELLTEVSQHCQVAGIKVSPSIHHPIENGWTREFIGFEKECKEEILWKLADSTLHTLTLIESLSQWKYDENLIKNELNSVTIQKGMYLYEPHSVVIRSKQSNTMYTEVGIKSLDSDSEYGISDELQQSPFFTAFEIVAVVTYKPKEMQRILDTLQWNERTEIKKRNFPFLPEEIHKKLRFHQTTTKFGVIVCTRHNGKLTAIFANRVAGKQDKLAEKENPI